MHLTLAEVHTVAMESASHGLRGDRSARRLRLAVGAGLLGLAMAAPALADCGQFDLSHTEWTTILQKRVMHGEVDYRGMLREDRLVLEHYLASLSAVCARDYEHWSRADKIAFWVNAYNASTVRLILDHYPIASIRKIGWLPGAAFREAFIPMPQLKGATISLNDIEHGTLRSAFREPRIHFALVCAARSCPPLRREAYRGADLEQQFEDQGRSFLHDTIKNRYDPATHMLELSSIFDWFRSDFESSAGSVQAFVGRYLELPTSGEVRIRYLSYDWSLNERTTP
jgi:hypothetical protein